MQLKSQNVNIMLLVKLSTKALIISNLAHNGLVACKAPHTKTTVDLRIKENSVVRTLSSIWIWYFMCHIQETYT